MFTIYKIKLNIFRISIARQRCIIIHDNYNMDTNRSLVAFILTTVS